MAVPNALVQATARDTVSFLVDVVLPTVAKGILIRRPMIVGLAERFALDARAVKRLQKLRAKYGAGPLLLAVPLRRQVVILAAEHVHEVLAGAPEPFSPATREKHAALAHFEPDVSLVSRMPVRAERRRFNEEVLESAQPVHSMAETFSAIIEEEAESLVAESGAGLDWDRFIMAWYRAVRRIVLGKAARDDHDLTDMLAKLRSAGNWAFLHPGRKGLMRRFHARLQDHLARAEPGSLAARIAARANTEATAPTHQVAQWLFASEAGGMATFRALALIAAHPEAEAQARAACTTAAHTGSENLVFLRACVLEALRLWPTTPVILRETTVEANCGGSIIPKNTHVIIYTPYFHRDETRLPYAHQFAPALWHGSERATGWPLIPFSEGPAVCPAHHLVPMLGSAMIAAVLARRRVELTQPERLKPDRPLPGTLDHTTLSFRLRAVSA